MSETTQRPSFSTRVASVAGGLVMALSSIVLLGWHVRSRNLVQLHPSWVGMAYNAALALLSLGLGLLAAAQRRRRLALVCAAWPLLISILTGVQYYFGLDLHVDELFCKVFYETRTPYPGRLAQNTALCLALAGSVLALLGSTARFKGRILLACLLSAAILTISNLALAGFLVGLVDSFGRGLFMRMAPHTAAALLVLALGLIALIFAQAQGRHAIFDLRHAVLGYAVLGTFVVALISSTLAVLPFYARLHTERSQNLLQMTMARAGALEQYLALAKSHARQISRRRYALLAAFNRGELSQPEFSDDLTEVFTRIIQDSPEIAGITRLGLTGKALLAVGQSIPAELLTPVPSPTLNVTVTGPVAIGSEFFVLMSTPVLNDDAQQLGTDIVLVKFSGISGMLSGVLSEANVPAAGDRTLLGLPSGAQIKLLALGVGPRGVQIVPVEPERDEVALMQQALDQARGNILVRHDVGPAVVMAYGPVKGSPWGLVTARQIDELYFGVGRQLLTVISGLFLLMLCGTGTVFLLVRPLTGRMLLHTDELEQRIQAQTESLAAELNERRQAEKALRQSQRQYELLVNSIEGIVWEADARTFAFTFVSPQAERLLGYPVARWLTEPQFWADHLHPEDRAEAINFCLRSTQAGEDHQFEYRMLAADGRSVWLRDFVSVVVEGNEVVKLRGLLVDITAHKEMEDELAYSRERFELATRGAVDGIWDWNVVTNEDYFSDRWCELLGYAPVELQPHFETWANHLHPDDKEFAFAAVQAHLKERLPYDLEYRLRTKSGAYRWFRASGQACWDATGQPIRMAGSLTDITERKRAEESLRQAHAELEQRVRARTAELSDSNLALQQEITERRQAEQQLRASEESLRRSEEQLRQFIERCPVSVAMFDCEMRYLAVSNRWLEDYKLGQQELRGRSHYAVFPEIPERWKEIHQRCLTGAVEHAEADPFRRSDGSVNWLHWEICPWRDRRGEIGGIIIASEDITARVQTAAILAGQKRILELIAANAPLTQVLEEIACFIERESGETVCAITLLEPGEQSLGWAAAPNVPAALQQQLPRFPVGPCHGSCGTAVYRGELVVVADLATDPLWETNREVPLSFGVRAISSTPIRGTQREILGTFALNFMTPRPPTAYELQMMEAFAALAGIAVERNREQAALETRVVERTRELAQTNLSLRAEVAVRKQTEKQLRIATEKAQTADWLKSAFLATMSHELRTPLNAILGFTGVILQGLAGPLTAEQQTQLGMVHSSGQHLLALINDVLDLSKIEAGEMKVSFAPCDLRATIEKIAATIQPLAAQKGLALRVSVAPTIGTLTSDQRRVEQILLNLLNNAIKFTAQGEVALGAEADGTWVRLRITDTGIGIRPEDLPTLFKPFQQLDTGAARQFEGTGLGLAICQRLASLLGGDIQAESTWGQGSALVITHIFTSRFWRICSENRGFPRIAR